MVRYVDLDLWHTQVIHRRERTLARLDVRTGDAHMHAITLSLHTQGHYGELTTAGDEAMREHVKAFHQLRVRRWIN